MKMLENIKTYLRNLAYAQVHANLLESFSKDADEWRKSSASWKKAATTASHKAMKLQEENDRLKARLPGAGQQRDERGKFLPKAY